MIRKLMLTALMAAVGGAVYKSLPDITRYLKLREM
jgi:hypothetical protein